MSTLYTVGYEGTDIERFVSTLKAVGVGILADVRAVAVSRKKGFSKNGLRERLEAEGITYVHFVELGDPKLGREAARAGKIEVFKNVYSTHLSTPEAIGALEVLYETAIQDTVCLMCFERDPLNCHRNLIADRMSARGLDRFHLYGDDPGRYVRHSKKIPSGHRDKGDAQPQPEAW
jgi:uncharacterized protein (DUF488 family)